MPLLRTELISTAQDLPEGWDQLGADILLKSQFLKALELGSPPNINNHFAAIYMHDRLVGGALFQHVRVNLGDMMRYSPDSFLVRKLKTAFSYFLQGHILVCGNLTHTGRHLFAYNDSIVSREQWTLALNQAIAKQINQIKYSGNNIQLVLIKDFPENEEGLNFKTIKNSERCYKVRVQPSMELTIRDDWKKIEHYVESLTKKYRRRYNTARNKLRGASVKELNEEDVAYESPQLYSLYLNVSRNAKFNTFILPPDHFLVYKRLLGDRFRVFGYYLNQELIGFYSLILNEDNLETYFLGYKTEQLQQRQLYLNMLYDMLEFAIQNKFKKVVYARTALEIKSSVGAEPEDMYMYIYHTNRFWNRMLKPIFNWLNPTEEWVPRNPFGH